MNPSRMISIASLIPLASLAGACATDPADDSGDPELVSESSSEITVAGLGHYCSGTWATGGWAFNSDTNGNDPCASIIATGGTVQRKGLYSSAGLNRVVYRCYPPGYGWVGTYEGLGNGPLTAAYNAAAGKPGCIFEASPTALPIFDAPFSLATNYNHGSGVDFARSGDSSNGVNYNVAEFGQIGSPTATIVDWKGRDVSGKFVDNHDGHDFGMPRGTPITSVADGVVKMSRSWLNPNHCAGSDTDLQEEVAIEHTVYRNQGSGYYEKFLTYYAHFTSRDALIVPGATVVRGQLLGLSGNSGCSTGPHLHFGVVRLTNTADQKEEVVHFLPSPQHSDGTDKAIEPYGWAAPQGFDPFSYRQYPRGALSVNLWRLFQAPSTGTW